MWQKLYNFNYICIVVCIVYLYNKEIKLHYVRMVCVSAVLGFKHDSRFVAPRELQGCSIS
jgi:hypothetical protein